MFLCGVTQVVVPAKVLLTSVVVFIVIPLAAGWLTRRALLKSYGRDWLEQRFLPKFQPVMSSVDYVRKPKLSREGANVCIVRNGSVVTETVGEYGSEGWIYQAAIDLPRFDGNYPVMGVWMVNHEACGLGIREDRTPVTGNLSRFIPHLFY